MRPSLGLVGRILVILLLTVTVEFCTSTLLYERASQFSLREDEAHRLAEHLVITRKLIAERPLRERAMMASLLTTDRYDVRWSPTAPPPPPTGAQLREMREQIVSWEPSLNDSNMRLRLKSPGLNSMVVGGMTLPDGTWIHFGTRDVGGDWDLALGRVVLALVPAMALLVIGSLLIRNTLKPVRMLAQAAERYGYGDRVILPEIGTGEVLRVIRAFNAMQDRIQRLIADRTQALAAVGHDLRTPIARLRLRIDMIGDAPARDAMRRDAVEMETMIASLLAFLGGGDSDEPVVRSDLAVMAATRVDDAADEGHGIRYEGPEHLDAYLRLYDMKRALDNLVTNALRHGKTVVVQVEQRGDRAILRVLDDGPGIPESRLDDARQPFVRLDSARGRNTEGLGLGLAIVERIVQAHAGKLHLANRPTGGLCAEIELPIAGPAAPPR
ncbi:MULTISPECIES: ATP-binding protein [unclassified Sphingomonas]|uniref:ATP-binding protein n=1 Tax=unclassified Sphingomonas TaxID=196159 RepID=UPI00070235F6|nr:MULTISPECIES: ATP-binding protein [unclassified Sphingomonas]KQX18165.1 histidine kinase [Sphingomonas sp. Root1294]KQY70969.1 histidine kinase [Sphingomonas sp. Root50]KRB92215.1 histidine kinase [Sphingomonas sp. Root720]